MPNIIIREIDNTTAGSSAYSNFSVAMAGPADGNGFDQNGILECSDLQTFEEAISSLADEDKDINVQMAKELLGMGYTILYKKVDRADEPVSSFMSYDFWEAFQDRANYDFRYVLQYVTNPQTFVDEEDNYIPSAHLLAILATQENIMKLAATRRDCFAICDVPKTLYANCTTNEAVNKIIAESNIFAANSDEEGDEKVAKYGAYFMPQVTYVRVATEQEFENKTFPAGFHYLACAKKAFLSFAEWYAVAGYTRGVSDYQIASLGAKFGDAAINKLQPRVANDTFATAINVITSVKNSKYLWGNRTAYALDNTGLVASHFLNIRQLCCTIKKEIYQACRKLTFDPNSDLLWLNFKGMVEPMLDRMQNDQGINGYELTKYTPKNAEKGKLYIKLTISPIEAVEDFDITIMLEDSNVELGE